MVAVLFVCLGNICRSPAGEGILARLAEDQGIDVAVASCGIGDWHVGQLPDARMRKAALDRGVVLQSRAQQFRRSFFDEYDYILAADHEVVKDLHQYAKTPEHRAKIHLMTAFSKAYAGEEVPDPYYGGRADFELVLDMLQDCCEGLLDRLQR